MKTLRSLICIGAGVVLSALSAQATPYASAVTNLSGNGTAGGTIQYRLNEPCTNVYVLYYPGAVSNNLGVNGTYTTTPTNGACVGVHTFSLVYQSTTYSSFAIVCYNLGTGSPRWISPANGATQAAGSGFNPGTNNLVDFNGPRGVAVNKNPSSPYFGTIYVCNASPGTDGTGRSVGKGLYALNADYTDAFGYGSNSMPFNSATNATTNAIVWGTSTTFACYHCYVGPDDMVYATDSGQSTALGGGVYMIAPNLATWSELYQHNTNTAGTAGVYFDMPSIQVQGSYSAGSLVVYSMEWDRIPYQSIWQYNFYTSPSTPLALPWPLTTAPSVGLAPSGTCGNDVYGNPFSAYFNQLNTNVSCGNDTANPVTADFAIAPDGKFFCTQYRATATGGVLGGNNGLFIYDSIANGNCLLFDSMEANGGGLNSGTDPFDPVVSVAVSPDDLFLAMGGTTAAATGGNTAFAGQIEICPLNYTNANNVGGLPNIGALTSFKFNTSANEGLRGIAFDLADNVYAESGSSSDTMREFTLGLTSQAVTSNDYTGADGSFVVSFPTMVASVTTSVSSEGYGTPSPGVITLTRSGPNIGSAVTLNYTVSATSTGTNGVDFTLGPASSVTFPANVTTEYIYVTNIEPTNVALPTLTAVVALTANNAQFSIVGPTNLTVYLADEGPQSLSITGPGAATMYRGLTNDFVSYVITRIGDTNAGPWTIPASVFTLGGGAVFNTDYLAGPQPVSYTGPATAGAGSGITVPTGAQTVMVEVGLPLPHASYTGPLTVVLSGSGGTSTEGTNFAFTGSPGTNTLLDNLNPPETVIWSDPLTASNSDSVNWNVAFSQNTGIAPYQFFFPNYDGVPTQDYDANFGANLGYDFVPNAPSGASNGLRVTVNKLSSGAIGTGVARAAGVNLYPNNSPYFSGNYALRFSMNLVRGCIDLTATEYVEFGINHYGTNVTWVDGSAVQGTGAAAFSFTNADGINFCIAADAGQFSINSGGGDFFMFAASNYNVAGSYFPSTGYLPLPLPASSGLPYTSFTNVFKNFGYPYDDNDTGGGPNNGIYNSHTGQLASSNNAGVPANVSGWAGDAYSTSSCFPLGSELVGPWTDVEVKQSNGVITMSLNKTVMFTYTNVTIFTNGYPMLGYFDPFDSLGNGGGAYFSNVRVIEIGPAITNPPVSVTVGAGTNASFTVGVAGLGPFTNTWYKGTNVVQVDTNNTAGTGDTDTLAFTPALTNNAGSYTVVVSDASGSVTSSVVTLTVVVAPTITGPTNVTQYYGGNAIFNATTVSGTTPFIYSWTSNGTTLATGGQVVGATTSSLTITNLVLADAATYAVKATNFAGVAGPDSATLTVLPSPNPILTNIMRSGTNLVFSFTNGGDTVQTTNSFTVQGSTNFYIGEATNIGGYLLATNQGFVTIANAVITSNAGVFTVTVPGTNAYKFYRIQHK